VEKQSSRQFLRRTFLFVSLFFLILPALAAAQSSAALIPSPKPADVAVEWKQLTGIYKLAETSLVVLERDGQLYIDEEKKEEWRISGSSQGGWKVLRASGEEPEALVAQRGADGDVTAITLGSKRYTRADAGSDPAQFYHVTLKRPIEDLRAEALRARPPEESRAFRKSELVELTALDAAFHLDIRYAQSNNFLSTPVYSQARAFMQRPAAEALVRALHKLQPLGYGLVIHDAYRPWYVTKIFWDATPVEEHSFVADPKKGSKHNRGCAVDITLYDLATGQAIEMPGLYDEMSPRSFPNFPGGTSLQRWHRDLLRRAIEGEGFTVDGNEWWHFDYKDWKEYPILNVPFEKLGALAAGGIAQD